MSFFPILIRVEQRIYFSVHFPAKFNERISYLVKIVMGYAFFVYKNKDVPIRV